LIDIISTLPGSLYSASYWSKIIPTLRETKIKL